VRLSAELSVNGKAWLLKFKLMDPNSNVDLGSKKLPLLGRQNELWKATCFEVFISRPSEIAYWEFNFSKDKAWNIYHFTDYRQPAPPKESEDFEIQSIEWMDNNLQVQIKSKLQFSQIEANFCAVLKLKTGETHYFSSLHTSQKPDFHQRKSIHLLVRPSDKASV